jgi:hypothetical protein
VQIRPTEAQRADLATRHEIFRNFPAPLHEQPAGQAKKLSAEEASVVSGPETSKRFKGFEPLPSRVIAPLGRPRGPTSLAEQWRMEAALKEARAAGKREVAQEQMETAQEQEDAARWQKQAAQLADDKQAAEEHVNNLEREMARRQFGNRSVQQDSQRLRLGLAQPESNAAFNVRGMPLNFLVNKKVDAVAAGGQTGEQSGKPGVVMQDAETVAGGQTNEVVIEDARGTVVAGGQTRDAAWDGLGNTVLTVTPEMQAEEIDRRLEQRAEARVVSELRALIEKGRKAAKAPESRVPSRPTQWQFTPSKQVLPDSLIGKFTEDVRGLLVNARNRDCHQWDWMMWADTFIDELRQVAVDLEKKNADVGLELQAYKTVLTLPEVLESKLDEMEKALQAFRAAMAEANTSGKLSEEVRPMLARAWTEDKEMKVSEELLGLYQELWSLIQETPRRRGEKAYPNLADMESFHRWQMDHATSSREPLSTRQPIGWVTKKKVPVVNQQHDYWRGRELVRWLRNERAYLDPTSPWFDALQDTDAALYIGHPCGVEQKMGYFGGIDDEYDARPAPKWWSSNLPLLPPELAEAHGTEE